jgi:hypothetical protein
MPARVNSEANGCSIAKDVRQKGFFFSYTQMERPKQRCGMANPGEPSGKRTGFSFLKFSRDWQVSFACSKAQA